MNDQTFTATAFPVGRDEADRLAAVEAIGIVGTAREAAFDAVVDLACKTFAMPVGLVTVLDASRQWFKAERGLGIGQTPREHALCNHVIAARGPLVVNDLALDTRFRATALVTGAPHLRFYAGVPLMLSSGHVVGTLCVLDVRPRRFSRADMDQLKALAGVAESLLRRYEDACRLADIGRDLAAHNALVESQRRQLEHNGRIMSRGARLARMGAWERDLRTGVYCWSHGMYLLHEVAEDFAVSQESVMAFYPPGERRRVRRMIEQARRTGEAYQIEARIVTGKGNQRWVRVTSEVEHAAGAPVRRIGMMQDITEEKNARDRIAQMAERDALTGLYNRAYLRGHIDSLAADRAGASHAFLLLDLDGFKDVNDTHGHAAGDECLRRVARRVARAAGRGALVARIGGDEFAILIDSRGGRSDVRALADQVRQAVQVPVRWQGQSFQLSVSIGIALRAGGSRIGSDEIFGDADLALYDAKAAGKNCAAVYRPQLKAEATRRFAIVRDIGRALKRGNLALHYQPKVGLADGAHQGFEALLRWVREDGSVVAAGAFGPALRDPGLSVEIGDFVLQSALEQAAAWTAAGVPFGSIAVNLGASQFRNRNLSTLLLGQSRELGLPPGAIEIEVTEDVFMSRATGHALEICHELKAGGMRIAFDDFGTGFASLTHLREFPVDVLKIDRSFISRLGTDANTTSIVHAVIDLAHNLDLRVVAEGVETAGQAQFLRAVGCEWAQGYLYARPMDARAAELYLGAEGQRLRA
jgi:diguanylate cyclase (GGDEF)-like protein